MSDADKDTTGGVTSSRNEKSHFAVGVDETFSIYYLIPLHDNEMYRRRDIPPLLVSTSLFHEAESRENL